MRLFHRNFEHAALFLARQIKYLARLRIDAETSTRPHEFFVLDEVLQKSPIRRLVDFHVLIEG
jgi:hypothetical protein